MRAVTMAIVVSAGLLFSAPAWSQGSILDINAATVEELDALPGIGPARAAAIVKGRPYKNKYELVSKKIVPQNIYNAIKDKLVAHGKS